MHLTIYALTAYRMQNKTNRPFSKISNLSLFTFQQLATFEFKLKCKIPN